MRRFVIITIMMKVISVFEKFADFHTVFLGVADFVVEHSHVFYEESFVEVHVGEVDAPAVSLDIVYLIHINRVSRIAHDIEQKRLFLNSSWCIEF